MSSNIFDRKKTDASDSQGANAGESSLEPDCVDIKFSACPCVVVEIICPNEKVTWFRKKNKQIMFEASMLLFMLMAAFAVIGFVYWNFNTSPAGSRELRLALNIYILVGGFLGGLTFNIKRFYRSVAKDISLGCCKRRRHHAIFAAGVDCKETKDDNTSTKNKVTERWAPQNFYWLLFTPFMAGIFAFGLFSFVMSGIIFPTLTADTGGNSNSIYFALPYILGLFADTFYGKLADWVEKMRTS